MGREQDRVGYHLVRAGGRRGSVPLRPHVHDEYLICAQLRGREECRVDGRAFTFAAGDLVLINPGQVHTGSGQGSVEVEYLSLHIDRELVAALARAAAGEVCEPEFVRVRIPAESTVVPALRRMWRHPEATGDLDLVHAAIVAVLERFSNLRDRRLRAPGRCHRRDIARALERLRGAIAGGDIPVLDELAAAAGLSRFHFVREFSRVVGMTPRAYARAVVLGRAARELRRSERPLAEIATAAGFAGRRSFARAFRRHEGVSPGAYRRAVSRA